MRLALICFLLLLSISAAHARVQVVTTTPNLADMARNLGGDLVEVRAIARTEQDPHLVEPRASYLPMLHDADLLVAMGLGLESGWLPNLIDGAHNARIRRGQRGYVDASVGVAVLHDPDDPVDVNIPRAHPSGNPHYDLDPANAKIIARNIVEGLKRVDAPHAATYEANLVAYVKRLSDASRAWAPMAARLKGAKMVTWHGTWPYFARRFGLTVVGRIEPSTRTILAYPTPGAHHLAVLAERMKARHVRLIVIDPFDDAAVARKLATESGARVLLLPSSVEGNGSYIELITHDLERLVQEHAGTR